MILRKMKAYWISDHPSFNLMMLWAAAVVTFFSFCCSGETTVEEGSQYDPDVHLSFSNVAVDDPSSSSVISLHIKRSKTDQARKASRWSLGALAMTSALWWPF